VDFSSKVGQLAGNHFISLTTGLDQLPELGRTVLWEGVKYILFESVEPGVLGRYDALYLTSTPPGIRREK
jgi:hypothetical protein